MTFPPTVKWALAGVLVTLSLGLAVQGMIRNNAWLIWSACWAAVCSSITSISILYDLWKSRNRHG